ncbi:MAG TPA: hypothetical protein VKU80_02525 [Planctomycetota bacterium]|nr:hypothetical protein [Planctomycetota bacterium]
MMAALVLVACLQAPTLDAEAGYQGTVFPDSWTRLTATVAYEGEPLDAELRVTIRSYGADPVVYRRSLRLVRKVRMRTPFDIYLTEYDFEAVVELVQKEKVLRKLALTLNYAREDTSRLLVVGMAPAFLVEALAQRPPITLVRQQPELLPSTALPLLPIRSILMAEPATLDAGQEAALEEWVRLGGRLIFGAARGTVLRQNSFWRGFCPLEAPATGSMAVPGKDGESLTLLRGNVRKGAAGSMLGDSPLYIRSREGEGEVVFIPFMLDQPALSKLVPSAPFLAELLQLPPPPKEEFVPRRGFVRREEWQLEDRRARVPEGMRSILRRLLPADWSLSLSALAVGVFIVGVYIVLLGPVDYWRLRRTKNLRSGWRSLVVLVVVFGGVVYVWAAQVSPRASRMTLVTLLDADRIRTFGAVRPARGDVYDLHAAGSLSLLTPNRAFGAPETTDPMVVTVPSEARLPIPPSETRMLVSSRPRTANEAGMSAGWADAGRKTLRIRNEADFGLTECWAVSRGEAWAVPPIPAASTVTTTLESPIAFATWARRLLKHPDDRPSWWGHQVGWDDIREDRYALVLTFYGAVNTVWSPDRVRHVLQDRSLDWSDALARGDVVVVGAFERNVAEIAITSGPTPQVYGWARLRVEGAGK